MKRKNYKWKNKRNQTHTLKLMIMALKLMKKNYDDSL